MITGNAEKYFSAFARCWPPHPEAGGSVEEWCEREERTRRYSIMHWRKRIKEGIAMIIGTKYCPPQPRSGLAVAEPGLLVKNIQRATKRSAIILA
jgi:hypothetical protein